MVIIRDWMPSATIYSGTELVEVSWYDERENMLRRCRTIEQVW